MIEQISKFQLREKNRYLPYIQLQSRHFPSSDTTKCPTCQRNLTDSPNDIDDDMPVDQKGNSAGVINTASSGEPTLLQQEESTKLLSELDRVKS